MVHFRTYAVKSCSILTVSRSSSGSGVDQRDFHQRRQQVSHCSLLMSSSFLPAFYRHITYPGAVPARRRPLLLHSHSGLLVELSPGFCLSCLQSVVSVVSRVYAGRSLIAVGRPWVTRRSPVCRPWVARGSPVSCSQVARGSPVGCSQVACGSPVGHP